MSSIYIKTGTEGPKHDPYGYEEITVEREGVTVMLHSGLDYFVKLNGKKVAVPVSDGSYPDNVRKTYLKIAETFEQYAGITAEVAKRALRKYKCRKIDGCRHKHTKWVDGFPGEEYEICLKCGIAVDYIFSESAII